MRALITLLITLLSVQAYAQKFTISLNGGYMFNTPPAMAKDAHPNLESIPAFTLRPAVALNLKKMQFGLGFDYARLKYAYRHDYFGQTPFGGIGEYYFEHEYNTSMATLFAFINRQHMFLKSNLYYGMHIGYTWVGEENVETVSNTGDKGTIYGPAPLPKACVGVQVGYRYEVYKGLSIQAEVGSRYQTVNPTLRARQPWGYPSYAPPYATNVKGEFFSFPVLVGLSYSL